MELQVKRSKAEKGKLLGGKKTLYVLELKATLSPEESALLLKYSKMSASLDPGEGVIEKTTEGKLEGPNDISLSTLLESGVQYQSEILLQTLADIPNNIAAECSRVLSQVRACEEWSGSEAIKIE